jgi:hypothetical protein
MELSGLKMFSLLGEKDGIRSNHVGINLLESRILKK